MILLVASFMAGMIPLVQALQTVSESDASGRQELIIVLVIILISFAAVMVFFMGSSLELRIDGSILQYRFKPLVNHWRTIRSEEIRQWEVRKYSALRESGGWGVRYSFRRNSTAYTIVGQHVLDLELASGNHILISTTKPEELESAMRKMMEREE